MSECPKMVRVEVAQGWLEGEELESAAGGTKYCSFKGIPYAEPPIRKLRFKVGISYYL